MTIQPALVAKQVRLKEWAKQIRDCQNRPKGMDIKTGFTDLRRGIDGLATIIRFQFQLDLYDKNTLFLFCGRRSDRIKGLLWEGDGFLLLYKRLDNGAFRWPRSADEALEITLEQYRMLMQGFEIVARNPIKELNQLDKELLIQLFIGMQDQMEEQTKQMQALNDKMQLMVEQLVLSK